MARQSIEERIPAVRILLASLYDYLPDPPTSSGLIAQSSLPGPAPGRRVPCGACRRTGKMRERTRMRICPLCDGLGWRPRRGPSNPSHPRYEEPYDEYTGEPIKESASPNPEPTPLRMLDRQLETLARLAALRAGETSSERYGWERERIVYDRKGSYQELRRALKKLEKVWPAGYAEIRRRYFLGVDVLLGPLERTYLEAAEEWIARDMRGPIRVPPWLADHDSQRRQRSVKELAAEGLTAGEIARVLRMPKRSVQKQLRATLASDASVTILTASAPGESA